jgi:site-specific DNA recombinase
MKTVALYARVSTPYQEKQGTIESQLAALTAYAAERGLAVSPEHRYVDSGYSGARLDRPGLERLRDAAWRGELDAVLILAPDRLARHYAYQYVVVEELERAGCAVLFIHGALGTSPQERLVREVQGLFAEFERAAFQERSRRGKLHAVRAGRFFAPEGPYGYTYLPGHDGQPGRFVVNEAEAAVVRQMFAWLIEEQLSVYAITRRLTANWMPTRRRHPAWSAATVYKVLTNPVYAGTHYYNRTENAPDPAGQEATSRRRPAKQPRRQRRPVQEWIPVPWEPLISQAVFDLATRQLQLNRERSPRKTRFPYLLQGLLVCGYCGRRLGGHAGVASGRYECTKRRTLEAPEWRCHLRSVSQPDIEPVVWDAVRQLLQQPRLILEHLRQQQEGESPDSTDAVRELKRLQRQRLTLAREEQRLIDAYQFGVIEVDELKERRQRLRETGQQVQQREQLVAAQVAQAQQATRWTETVTAFCQRIAALLEDPAFATRQRVLRLVVERIVITDDQIVIQHIIPTDEGSRLYLRRSRPREPLGGCGAGTKMGTGAAGAGGSAGS